MSFSILIYWYRRLENKNKEKTIYNETTSKDSSDNLKMQEIDFYKYKHHQSRTQTSNVIGYH